MGYSLCLSDFHGHAAAFRQTMNSNVSRRIPHVVSDIAGGGQAQPDVEDPAELLTRLDDGNNLQNDAAGFVIHELDASTIAEHQRLHLERERLATSGAGFTPFCGAPFKLD